MKKKRQCAVCKKPLPTPQERFVVEVRGYAWPEMPEIAEDVLEEDLEAEVNELLERMRHAGPEEIEELQAQVFFEYDYILCGECYRRFAAHPVPEKRELYLEDESWE